MNDDYLLMLIKDCVLKILSTEKMTIKIHFKNQRNKYISKLSEDGRIKLLQWENNRAYN